LMLKAAEETGISFEKVKVLFLSWIM
jgi:hypothetical protein